MSLIGWRGHSLTGPEITKLGAGMARTMANAIVPEYPPAYYSYVELYVKTGCEQSLNRALEMVRIDE
jgi:hypothetical protein